VVTLITVLQVICSIALIAAITIQTTKSESSSGATGMGWGVIGGKATSSVERWGLEQHLNRITTILAVAFMVVSLLSAIAWSR